MPRPRYSLLTTLLVNRVSLLGHGDAIEERTANDRV